VRKIFENGECDQSTVTVGIVSVTAHAMSLSMAY